MASSSLIIDLRCKLVNRIFTIFDFFNEYDQKVWIGNQEKKRSKTLSVIENIYATEILTFGISYQIQNMNLKSFLLKIWLIELKPKTISPFFF